MTLADQGMAMELPDDPPELSGAGWRALLALLVEHEELEHGPEWRSQLSEVGGVSPDQPAPYNAESLPSGRPSIGQRGCVTDIR